MSKKSIFHRSYRHLILPGITIGVDVSNKGGRIAVAAARLDDGYCRDTGRYIINTLFDENDQTLRAAQFTRNVFSTPYMRGFSGTEVIQPLLDFISESLNERAVYRVLRQLFIHDATTKEKAKKAAEKWKNSRLVSLYANVVEELHKEDVAVFGKLKTLKQFDNYFFDWRGSANAVINGVSTFAQLMYQEMELESELKSVASLLADAKKEPKSRTPFSPKENEAKEPVAEEQLEKWRAKLKKLTSALIKTKKVTGAALRKKVPVEKTAKPVKVLPRASSAPSGRPIGIAPCLDVLEKISPPGTPPPLPVLAESETPAESEKPPPLPVLAESETPPPLPLEETSLPLSPLEEEIEAGIAKVAALLQDPEVSSEESDDVIQPPQSVRPPIELLMLPED